MMAMMKAVKQAMRVVEEAVADECLAQDQLLPEHLKTAVDLPVLDSLHPHLLCCHVLYHEQTLLACHLD